jgi:hypothetical protein
MSFELHPSRTFRGRAKTTGADIDVGSTSCEEQGSEVRWRCHRFSSTEKATTVNPLLAWRGFAPESPTPERPADPTHTRVLSLSRRMYQELPKVLIHLPSSFRPHTMVLLRTVCNTSHSLRFVQRPPCRSATEIATTTLVLTLGLSMSDMPLQASTTPG